MSDEEKKDAAQDVTEDVTTDVTADVTTDVTVDETQDEDLTAPAPAPEPAPAAAPEEPPQEPAAGSAAARIRRAAPERLASDYELKELRKLNADPRFKRRVIGWTVLGVLLAIGLSCLYYRSTLTESSYLWPGALANKFNDGEIVFRYRNRDAFQIYYPKAQGMKVEQDAEKLTATITTKIGTYYECPFRITFESYSETNWWAKTLQQVVAEWKKRESDSGTSFEDITERIGYLNPRRMAGCPCAEGRFTSRDGIFYCIGRWTLFRDLDRVFVIRRFVRGVDYLKARSLLEGERCLNVAFSLTDIHFEVPETLRTEPSMWLIRYVRNEMARDFANADWKSIEHAIKTLLVRAYRDGDKSLIGDAMRLWMSYRNEQQLWYNRRRFAYRCALREGDEETIRLIRAESLKKFSNWDDVRRRRILNGDWGQ